MFVWAVWASWKSDEFLLEILLHMFLVRTHTVTDIRKARVMPIAYELKKHNIVQLVFGIVICMLGSSPRAKLSGSSRNQEL